MKKNILALTISLFSFASIAQNKADGNLSEWELPLKNYDLDAHIQYSTTNNDSMLFLCIRISDARFQMKIVKGGMSVFIDTTGKKKQFISINYPVKSNEETPQKMERPGAGALDVGQVKKMVEPSLKQFNTKGFITGNGTYIQKNIEGITAVGAYDEMAILNIEYQIPFKTFYHDLTTTDKDKKLTLSIVINGLPMPQFSGNPPGGDGPPGGGPPAGMPDPQEMEQLFQSTTTIIKYSIQLNN
ncbi:MAG: hypothetical protein JNM51_10280 [Bacteroidia bacterium]|nr:hypothetical protein [Bacteroidia bacterium]